MTLRPISVAVALAGAACLWATVPLVAQDAGHSGGPPAATGRVEIGAGWVWTGTTDLGGGPATLTANPAGGPFTLFTTSASFGTPLGGGIRVGYRVTPWLIAGIAGEASQGDITVRIDGDSEGAPALRFAGEVFAQAKVGARVDVLVPRLGFWGGRVTPHVAAFAGILRQWHQGNVLVETGRVYEGGAGVRVLFARRPAARLSRMGVLAEIRASHLAGGYHWGREARTAPAATLEFFSGWGK